MIKKKDLKLQLEMADLKIKMLIELGSKLIKDVTKLKQDKVDMIREMNKRDEAFLDYLKVEIEEVKIVENDMIKTSYKLIKK